MTLPLALKLKLLWAYGIKDYSAACKVYSAVFSHFYEYWESEDWKDWLETYRFNSDRYAAFAKQHPYLAKNKSTSWKECKKYMSKACWRARMLKSTPDKRPSCLSFKHSQWYRRAWSALLPDDYCVAMHWRTTEADVYKWPFTSACELAMHFDMQCNEVVASPEHFAVSIFTTYIQSLAHELLHLNNDEARVFYGCKEIPAGGFTVLLDALKMTPVFDAVLSDKRTYSALRVFCKWYSRAHTISGAYAVLSSNRYNGEIYKKDVAYAEIVQGLSDVLRHKQQAGKVIEQ